jgi:hypothetical protein
MKNALAYYNAGVVVNSKSYHSIPWRDTISRPTAPGGDQAARAIFKIFICM